MTCLLALTLLLCFVQEQDAELTCPSSAQDPGSAEQVLQSEQARLRALSGTQGVCQSPTAAAPAPPPPAAQVHLQAMSTN